MSRQKIKAILFDFGETLVRFGNVDKVDLFREGARLSYDYLRKQGQPAGNFRWYCWRNLTAIRFHYLLNRLRGEDFDSLELLQNINLKRGIKLNEQQWAELVWCWYEPLSRIGQIEDDISETMKTLSRQLGLKLGIVSNTFVPGVTLDKHLEQIGIKDYFSPRIYSCHYEFRKPDERIYELAAKEIGEAYENILFIGDKINKDVSPPLKLGMHAVVKEAWTNAGKATPEGAWRIEKLSELVGIVEKINAESSNQTMEHCREKPA